MMVDKMSPSWKNSYNIYQQTSIGSKQYFGVAHKGFCDFVADYIVTILIQQQISMWGYVLHFYLKKWLLLMSYLI